MGPEHRAHMEAGKEVGSFGTEFWVNRTQSCGLLIRAARGDRDLLWLVCDPRVCQLHPQGPSAQWRPWPAGRTAEQTAVWRWTWELVMRLG